MYNLVAIACVASIAIGQILFKLSAISLQRSGSLFDAHTLRLLILAFTLYGITTLAWVWVLQKMDLGRAYPLMALAFVFVPTGSYFFLGEQFHPQYFGGVLLIVLGIIVATSA
jgi:drug/metabolite transporter (DMT)-like permease